eukprot:1309026-Rhodomonas_salina.2
MLGQDRRQCCACNFRKRDLNLRVNRIWTVGLNGAVEDGMTGGSEPSSLSVSPYFEGQIG